MENLNERQTEEIIEDKLKSKGWKSNLQVKVYRNQTCYYQTESGEKKWVRPDYIFYDFNNNPLLVLEVKKKDSQILGKCLEKAKFCAEMIKCPVAMASDSSSWFSYHLKFQQQCLSFDQPFSDLPTPEELRQLQTSYFYSPYHHGKILQSANDLNNLLKPIEKKLWKEGLKKGDERFTEICKLLFLRLISQPDDPKNSWGKIMDFQVKNNSAELQINEELKIYRDKYKIDKYAEEIKIKNPQTVKFILEKFDEIDFLHSNLEIKGEVFQYFLGHQGKSDDLAQYFTPRNIVRFMVNFLKPKPSEKIYDPFCGSGGILVEVFDFVSRQIKHDKEYGKNRKILQEHSLYGNDIATIAYVAKLNMILSGDGHNNIQKCDSLEKSVNDEHNLVITNIPFNSANNLCVKHCLEALKKEKRSNPRAGIIVPDSFLFDKPCQDLRKDIFENFYITVVSLPEGAFQPYTPSKGSILFLFRKGKSRERERERERTKFAIMKLNKSDLPLIRKKKELPKTI